MSPRRASFSHEKTRGHSAGEAYDELERVRLQWPTEHLLSYSPEGDAGRQGITAQSRHRSAINLTAPTAKRDRRATMEQGKRGLGAGQPTRIRATASEIQSPDLRVLLGQRTSNT